MKKRDNSGTNFMYKQKGADLYLANPLIFLVELRGVEPLTS